MCMMYASAQGDNMFSLFGAKFAQSAHQYMLLAAAIMIPTVWLPNLSALSFLGVFGVGATASVLASVRECIITSG